MRRPTADDSSSPDRGRPPARFCPPRFTPRFALRVPLLFNCIGKYVSSAFSSLFLHPSSAFYQLHSPLYPPLPPPSSPSRASSGSSKLSRSRGTLCGLRSSPDIPVTLLQSSKRRTLRIPWFSRRRDGDDQWPSARAVYPGGRNSVPSQNQPGGQCDKSIYGHRDRNTASGELAS